MKQNTKFDSPIVTKPAANITTAHFMSPLINAGKKPKKNVDHEKPTGASFIKPPLATLTAANAVLYLFRKLLLIQMFSLNKSINDKKDHNH